VREPALINRRHGFTFATALVADVWRRILHDASIDWQSRTHFYRVVEPLAKQHLDWDEAKSEVREALRSLRVPRRWRLLSANLPRFRVTVRMWGHFLLLSRCIDRGGRITASQWCFEVGNMATLFAGLIVISAVTVVIGCLTWRSGGRNLPLVSGAIGAGSAAMLVDDSLLQIMLGCVFVILLLTSVLTIRSDIWRTIRTELLIGATAALVILGLSLDSGSLPENALLGVVALFVTLFLLTLGRRAFGALRVAARSK
jgi:hypothetical protein